MSVGIPQPELRFGSVLFGLLALMWLGGRLARSDGRPISSGRALALAGVYTVMYLGFVAPPLVTPALFSCIGLAVVHELRAAFAGETGVSIAPATAVVLYLIGAAVPWLLLLGPVAPTRLAPAFGVLAVIALVAPWSGGQRWRQYAALLTSSLVVLALDMFCLLRFQARGAALCLFAFFLINVADTAAYFSGKLFGRRKLAPKISPNKTVEGAIGSLLVTVVVALLFTRVLELPFTPVQALIAALGLNVLGQAGDLMVSLLKRRLGRKDFSTVLGGHGGVLDRFDSCILSVPAFVVWLGFIR